MKLGSNFQFSTTGSELFSLDEERKKVLLLKTDLLCYFSNYFHSCCSNRVQYRRPLHSLWRGGTNGACKGYFFTIINPVLKKNRSKNTIAICRKCLKLCIVFNPLFKQFHKTLPLNRCSIPHLTISSAISLNVLKF